MQKSEVPKPKTQNLIKQWSTFSAIWDQSLSNENDNENNDDDNDHEITILIIMMIINHLQKNLMK